MPTAEFKGGATAALIDVSGVPYEEAFHDEATPTQEVSMVEQAGRPPITLYVNVEGLGGVDYSVRIEVPAFDDHVQAIGRVLGAINELLFAQDWWGGTGA